VLLLVDDLARSGSRDSLAKQRGEKQRPYDEPRLAQCKTPHGSVRTITLFATGSKNRALLGAHDHVGNDGDR